MKNFNIKDLPPIPIETVVLEGAYRLKRNGLKWEPRVGCFVWDRESVLPVPSPFPLNVFFVLSMKRFLQFFDDVGTMEEKLVWIPTIGQAIGDLPRHGNAASRFERFRSPVADRLCKERTPALV
jgi:hypothetical protein